MDHSPPHRDWLAGWRAWLKRGAYSGCGRDRWQRPVEVIAALHIRPGACIAEIGCGGGYFAFHLASAAGPQGKVYAVDVDPDLVDDIAARVRRRRVDNIETILAAAAEPHLPAAAIDLVFTSNAYHHLSDRAAYFRRVRSSLTPNGHVAIIDSNGTGWFNKLFGHWTPRAVIENEMHAAGYRLERAPAIVPRQHFLIFALEA
ncbi:MAG TPA: methyltransferase [Candidatus Acidoferrales bacterium]|nr:methyltransferase [Candidatus Acidoferrales bacterium]